MLLSSIPSAAAGGRNALRYLVRTQPARQLVPPPRRLHGSAWHAYDAVRRASTPTESVGELGSRCATSAADALLSSASATEVKQHWGPSLSPRAIPAEGIDIGIHADTAKQGAVHRLVRAYQSHGHYVAKTDPLGIRLDAREIRPSTGGPDPLEELELSYHGLTAADLDLSFTLGPELLPHFATGTRSSMTLREIIAACQRTFCGSLAVEYLHIPDRTKREWLQERLQVPQPIQFTRDDKLRILDGLVAVSSFERFLAVKFPHDKRYGLDGAEGLAPAIQAIFDRSADSHGIQEVIMGSCHRGRLTMLAGVYGKPPELLFEAFSGLRSDIVPGTPGDVKVHIGHEGQHTSAQGNRVGLSVLANPSHLEAVDPVATGKAFATQRLAGDAGQDRIMCLALHGDAAFAGQGMVYEILGLSRLADYDVGGTVRLIVNNQVGFTTDAHCARSTSYASDLAKFINAPILHVNADDAEAVAFACRVAADWRAEFRSDIVVDLVCYRKYGHNEFDQPSFTQPLMYQQVAKQTAPLEKYVDKLTSEGTCTRQEIDERLNKEWDRLQRAFDASKETIAKQEKAPVAQPAMAPTHSRPEPPTSVEQNFLNTITEKITTVPDGFETHSGLRRALSGRQKLFEQGIVDWSTAEALAFGSLVLEGRSVRVAGQDVQRGTFSQRHAVWHDQVTGKTWTPLAHMSDTQARFDIANSPLGELGALGFEYGITLADTRSLVMWEAQFGDFANNAQVIIDNFLTSGESKWQYQSGLVLSLPHGHDGQGSEHSSARIERFLMLGNDEGRHWPADLAAPHQNANMDIVYMTTPANYFHVLRRQALRVHKRPLIIFFSKSLLRHPQNRSTVSQLMGSSAFAPVISDPEHGKSIDAPESISRVIFCTGQVYFALCKRRESLGLRNVAITRLEQLHPFPWVEVMDNVRQYPNAKAFVWAQEEHHNGGAWHFMRDRLDNVLRETEQYGANGVLYAGRAPSASTAAGTKSLHDVEEDALLGEAFTV
ncbi:Oxoglutarate dehydrogenase (succinyl-transferring) [Purpureocillium takamizusanense]|uniref:Oxoglutarate dehydrogenase (Succinyl-transferring) n=1 Tax=Purpureocillium takamizusanense TaxID=2060973 RepID=A0A9Q8VG92_9HYPO|nr:Oxoglutarate dehydrogenase (succinyl-transferring) [Purpureocillium takamizusanense]UNI23704.1 Oxoglutarate dehydrogenase (succinyl-transferring) [Purpureocillium takamizusanense]